MLSLIEPAVAFVIFAAIAWLGCAAWDALGVGPVPNDKVRLIRLPRDQRRGPPLA